MDGAATAAGASASTASGAAASDSVNEITALALNNRLNSGEKIFLLDVRNPEEYILCNLPGSNLMPLPELPKHLEDFDRSMDIVVYCKSGARSRRAIHLLREAGFQKLTNLTGGILGWIAEVDPSMPGY